MRIVIMLLALRRGASLNPERLKHVPKGWRVAAPSAADGAEGAEEFEHCCSRWCNGL